VNKTGVISCIVIPPLQFGRVSIVGTMECASFVLMMFPFAQQISGRAKQVPYSDDDIATSVGVGGSTVYRTKQRFVLDNLEAALSEEPRPGAVRKLSGKEEALLVATACSKPPQGRARWTLELLAGELVSLTEHNQCFP
jgi:hypothetical protein